MKLLSMIPKIDSVAAVVLLIAAIYFLYDEQYVVAFASFSSALISSFCAKYKPAQLFASAIQAKMVVKRKF